MWMQQRRILHKKHPKGTNGHSEPTLIPNHLTVNNNNNNNNNNEIENGHHHHRAHHRHHHHHHGPILSSVRQRQRAGATLLTTRTLIKTIVLCLVFFAIVTLYSYHRVSVIVPTNKKGTKSHHHRIGSGWDPSSMNAIASKQSNKATRPLVVVNRNEASNSTKTAPLPLSHSHVKTDYVKSNETFGACLLIQDDTIRLLEWLAYHYTVLPLGTLIVAIDPKSSRVNQIINILNLWETHLQQQQQQQQQTSDNSNNNNGRQHRHSLEIHILPQNDTWMSPLGEEEGWGRPIRNAATGAVRPWFQQKKSRWYWSQVHKRRQNYFVFVCQQMMQDVYGKSWITLTDSDEFVLYNYPSDDEDPTIYDAIDQFHNQQYFDIQRAWAAPYRAHLPTMKDRVTIMDYLTTQNDLPDANGTTPSCIRMPHLQFSSQEEEDHRAVGNGTQLDNSGARTTTTTTTHLMTYRQIHCGAKTGDFAKVLLNMQTGQAALYFSSGVMNIHTPNRRMCGRVGYTGSGADYSSHVLRIHHYRAGTMESFLERASDYRVGDYGHLLERYLEERNIESVSTDNHIHGWLPWFIDKVGGLDEANTLLLHPLAKAYEEFHTVAEQMRAQARMFTTDHIDNNGNDEDGMSNGGNSTRTKIDWGNLLVPKTIAGTEGKGKVDGVVSQDSDRRLPSNHLDLASQSLWGCVLLKDDDTQWLPEWLAYHATVGPLRFLTVGIKTTLKETEHTLEILRAWNNTKYFDLSIDVWYEASWLEGVDEERGYKRKVRNHVDGSYLEWFQDKSGNVFHEEQKKRSSSLFHSKCMKEIAMTIPIATPVDVDAAGKNNSEGDTKTLQQQEHHRWALMVEVQDFVLPNYISREEKPWLYHSVIEGSNEPYRRSEAQVNADREHFGPIRKHLPRMSSHVTLVDLLQAHASSIPSCVRMPELIMTMEVDPKKRLPSPTAEQQIDPLLRKTLRTVPQHRHGLMAGDVSKTMFDLAQCRNKQMCPWDDIYKTITKFESIYNAHRGLCGKNGHLHDEGKGTDYIAAPLRYQRYNSKLQPHHQRGSNINNTAEAGADGGESDGMADIDAGGISKIDQPNVDIVPWITWFVEKVGGQSQADELLFRFLTSTT